jgi:CRISPR-associated endoribonuclease Cas6
MGVPVDLNFVQLIFTVKLAAGNADPYALFAMRPYFIESFRQTVNCGQPQCEPCPEAATCPYNQILTQPLSADPAALKRYQKPSLPFVFDIPVLPPNSNRGSTMELGLIIAGSAVNCLGEYIAATGAMLRNPGFMRRLNASILKVETVGYRGIRHIIMEPGGGVETGLLEILSVRGLQEAMVLPSDTVTLTIVTPMRIMGEGKPLRKLSFSPFVRALFRRLSSLAYYYGGEEAELDYKWLAEQSRLVECVAADVRWVEWGNKWSGLIGTATFTGDMSEYRPFLLAGEYLHVGKGASFGLGSFLINKTV